MQLLGQGSDSGDQVREILDQFRPDLKPYEALYKDFHRDPELSNAESKTASIVAKYLRELGFDVQTGIGGHGLVAAFRNGSGPTVMLRSEMDALPIHEETGLPYASTKTMTDPSDGKEKPVMHACGHDMHMSCLMAASDLLKRAHKEWTGTLVCVFQPAEELLSGAQAMVDDDLFGKIPTPDVMLTQHLVNSKAGDVSIREGLVMSAADTFDVRVFGKGGHGAAPEKCIDPIVLASQIVIRLQTIRSREIAPESVAIVTCGSLHAGETANIIPDFADLKIDLRTFEPTVREQALSAIKRIVNAECKASGADKAPQMTRTRSCPSVVNDETATAKLQCAFRTYFGGHLSRMSRDGASDDFAVYTASTKIPSVYWNIGSTDRKKWNDADRQHRVRELIPGGHSAHFSPVIEPTLETGTNALALAALTFFRDHEQN